MSPASELATGGYSPTPEWANPSLPREDIAIAADVSVPVTTRHGIADALDGLATFQQASLKRAEMFNDGLLSAAAFFAPNYVRQAVLATDVSAEAALVAASFLTDYFQTEEGQCYTPDGRVRFNKTEQVR